MGEEKDDKKEAESEKKHDKEKDASDSDAEKDDKKDDEEAKEKAKQAATLKILRAINGIKNADKDSFAEAKAALDKTLEENLPATGDLGPELKDDAQFSVERRAK